MKRKIFLTLAAAALSLCCTAQAETPIHVDSATEGLTGKAESTLLNVPVKTPVINQISDVVYKQAPTRGYPNTALKMDILRPMSKEKLPAVVFIPGGGFLSANKDNNVQLRMYLAEHGYVIASVEYRVAPTSTFPAPLEDVKAAVRYLKAHADQFGIDPDRIGVIGGSAGGYLSAFVGVTSGSSTFDKGDNLNYTGDVKAAVDLYGLSDLTRIGEDYSEDVQAKHRSPGATEALWVNGSPVFGGTDGGINANPEKADAANPISYISPSSAPMLLMHGTADTVVSPSQTDLLFQALRQKNIPAERYLVKDAAHGGIYWNQEEVLRIITDFFDRCLKK